jgi:hypothetical protein
MKSTRKTSSEAVDMLPEYEFDYSKAHPNRFAGKAPVTVTLDPDVAEVFTTSEAVNKALRAILSALPESRKSSYPSA